MQFALSSCWARACKKAFKPVLLHKTLTKKPSETALKVQNIFFQQWRAVTGKNGSFTKNATTIIWPSLEAVLNERRHLEFATADHPPPESARFCIVFHTRFFERYCRCGFQWADCQWHTHALFLYFIAHVSVSADAACNVSAALKLHITRLPSWALRYRRAGYFRASKVLIKTYKKFCCRILVT